MTDTILALNIIDGPAFWIPLGLAIAFVLYLVIRKPSARWIATAVIGILGGGALGAVIALVITLTNAFGTALPVVADIWIIVFFAGIGLAVVNLWRSRWWRKVIAAVGIGVFALATTLGINAHYGLNQTVAAFLGTTTGKHIDVPGKSGVSMATLLPLYKHWTPPADMPKTGKTGTQVIPNTLSGFNARPAGIYLPPAALVKNPPELPFVLMMMGQPGNPDPQFIADQLNKQAAANKGLAPIVVVADQLGDPNNDPACTDSDAFGKAQTYITHDVVNWAKQNLHILPEAKYWTIVGYSNGGACAFKFAAQSPTVWGNLLSISGESYAGSEDPAGTIQSAFGGNAAAFEAAKPSAILAAHPGAYHDVTAIFTAGGNDPAYITQAQQAAAAAKAAGMNTTMYVVPGAGHVIDAIVGGLAKGFQLLYPRLGLSAPGP